MKFKSSLAALDAYNAFGEIHDIAKNKKELEKIDLQISENEMQFQEGLKKQGINVTEEEDLQVDIDERYDAWRFGLGWLPGK